MNMRPASILIRSIDGKIYKITDLINGKKIPLTENDLKAYDMHASSGVVKDIDGSLIDLATIYSNSGKVEISDTLPENPNANAIYVDKNARSIMIFDEEVNDWVSVGGGELSPDDSLTKEDINEIISAFKSL